MHVCISGLEQVYWLGLPGTDSTYDFLLVEEVFDFYKFFSFNEIQGSKKPRYARISTAYDNKTRKL